MTARAVGSGVPVDAAALAVDVPAAPGRRVAEALVSAAGSKTAAVVPAAAGPGFFSDARTPYCKRSPVPAAPGPWAAWPTVGPLCERIVSVKSGLGMNGSF